MSVLSESEIAHLLAPYTLENERLAATLGEYLELLLRWNAHTNLTAIRKPEEIVRRHFGESLFVAAHLGEPAPDSLLDLGSGAGFPGLPIALAHPGIAVTLAESQNKKATFLREAVRTLGVKNAEVWGSRAESLPSGRRFHTVTLRAVDNMEAAVAAAAPLAMHQILILAGTPPAPPEGFAAEPPVPIPGAEKAVLSRWVSQGVGSRE